MNLRAESIHLDDLKNSAVRASKNVLADRAEKLGLAEIEVGLFPDIGLVGARLPDIALENLKASEVVDLSQQIAGDMGEIARGAEPVVILGERIGTMGWFPVNPVLFEKIR